MRVDDRAPFESNLLYGDALDRYDARMLVQAFIMVLKFQYIIAIMPWKYG
jgi:hypothetical protein